MSDISTAFSKLGLDPSLAGSISASSSLAQAVDQFSSSQVGQSAAEQFREALGTVLPPILRTSPLSGGLRFTPQAGTWESVHYANDLINRQPKFKFLFKVKFEGFSEDKSDKSQHEFFVTRCDKPKVQLNHTDVNYYNFRSKVLTSVTFAPLSMTFLDEIGDSVNLFFREYMKKTSGQGKGYTGIDGGSTKSSSTIPYSRGSSVGKAIIIQQIFGNGLADNKFIFKNPRIEAFDFDELSMDDSTSGSTMMISFNYDALECITGDGSPMYTWGNTDIGGAGGSSNFANAGADSANSQTVTGSGGSIMAGKSPIIKGGTSDVADSLRDTPRAIVDLVRAHPKPSGPNQASSVSSAGTVLDRGIQQTREFISSGFNLKYAGSQEAQYGPQ